LQSFKKLILSRHLQENLRLVALLRAIGKRHGLSAGEIAVAWTLRHPVVTGAIVGATGFYLSTDDTAEIEQFVETHPLSVGNGDAD
jgi:predicted oxidoreductase